MAHLWPARWYQFQDKDEAVLENIGAHWAKIGYDQLTEKDYVRLECFLEPFDAIYSDEEVVVLSRVGNNGVQKEFCRMFIEPPLAEDKDKAEKWVLEWYLEPADIRREHLVRVSIMLYGKAFENDETQCMIMLTHAMSSLRQLKIVVKGDTITGELDDIEKDEAVFTRSIEDVNVESSVEE